jgi:hypothetical protein
MGGKGRSNRGLESKQAADTAWRIEAIKIASLLLEIGLQLIPARKMLGEAVPDARSSWRKYRYRAEDMPAGAF